APRRRPGERSRCARSRVHSQCAASTRPCRVSPSRALRFPARAAGLRRSGVAGDASPAWTGLSPFRDDRLDFRRVNVLAVVHGSNVPPGIFGEELDESGHRLEAWSLAWSTPPPRPIDDYDAVLVFGGAMHADQDDRHPWLRQENLFIQRLLDLHIPMLGVCLGAQLIAKAAGAQVRPASTPEVGCVDVELTEEAATDPVFSS